MSKPKLAHTAQSSTRNASRILAEARAKKPSQVVVWYSVPGGETGVLLSSGTDRVKTVGALTAAAYEVWIA